MIDLSGERAHRSLGDPQSLATAGRFLCADREPPDGDDVYKTSPDAFGRPTPSTRERDRQRTLRSTTIRGG